MRSVNRPIRRVHYIPIVLGVSLGAVIGLRSFDLDQTKVFAEDRSGTVLSSSPSGPISSLDSAQGGIPVPSQITLRFQTEHQRSSQANLSDSKGQSISAGANTVNDPTLVRQAEDLFIAGAEAEQQGNNAEAEKAYLRCSQFAQEHRLQEFIVPVYHRLAVLKAKLKQFDQSESYFKQVIPDCGENVSLLSDYAKLYINQHRYDEAETILKNIILFAPNDQQVLYNLGYVVAVQPDRQIEGLRYMKLALGEKEAYREIAKIYRTHGNENQAAFAEQRSRMNATNQSNVAHASPEDLKELQDHIKTELMRKEALEIAEEYERTKIVKTLPSDSPVLKEVAPRKTRVSQIKILPQSTEPVPAMPEPSVVQTLPKPSSAPIPTPVPVLTAASIPALVPVAPPAPTPVLAPAPQAIARSAEPDTHRQEVSISKQVPMDQPIPRPEIVTTPIQKQESPKLLVQGNSLRTETSNSGSLPSDRQVELRPSTNQKIPNTAPVPPAVSVVQVPRQPNSMDAPRADNNVSVFPQRQTAIPTTSFKLEFVPQNEVASDIRQRDADDKPVLAFRFQSTNAVMEQNDFQALVDHGQNLITPEENRPSFALRTIDSGGQSTLAMRPRVSAPSPMTTSRSNHEANRVLAPSPASSPAPTPEALALQKFDNRPSFVAQENAGRIALSKEKPHENSSRKAPIPESVVRPKLEFVHEQPKPQEEHLVGREGLAARTIAKAPIPVIAQNPAPVPMAVTQKPIVSEVGGGDKQQTAAPEIAQTQQRSPVAWSRPVVEPHLNSPQTPETVASVPEISDPGIVRFELPDQPLVVWSQPTLDRQQDHSLAALPILQSPISETPSTVKDEIAQDQRPTPSVKESVLVTGSLNPYPSDKIPSSLFDSRTDMSRMLETLNVTNKVAMVKTDIAATNAGFATTRKGVVNSNEWELLLHDLAKSDTAVATSDSPSKAISVPTKPVAKAEENAVIVRTIEPDELDDVGFARSSQYGK